MVVYIDDAEPVSVEQLTLDEARTVLARTQAAVEHASDLWAERDLGVPA